MSHLTSCSFFRALGASILCASSAFAGGGANGTTQRVSLTNLGQQVFAASRGASISRDGQRIAFESDAALVPADTNGHTDIYVFDRSSGTLTFVSYTSLGFSANGPSRHVSISGDGRWVAYETLASNVSGLDFNGDWDVMLRDLQTGALERVTQLPSEFAAADEGGRRPHVSFDGRYVVFDTYSEDYSALDANSVFDVYVRDMQLDTFTLVSVGFFAQGNGSSTHAQISDNGRYVVFHSDASNFAFGDTNAESDVFVRDLQTGALTLVSRVPGGAIGNDASYAPTLSADGRYVAFNTFATNFKAGDANGAEDAFVFDRTLNVLNHVSATPNGAFASSGGGDASLSADGQSIAFVSSAPELIGGGPAFLAVYVRELNSGVTRLASRASGIAALPNGASYRPSLNGDGSVVAFDSVATNLVAGDVNLQGDVFVRTLYADPLTYCTSSLTSGGCEPSMSSVGLPRVSQNAGFLVGCSDVPNNKFGLFFYGFGGRQAVPFGGGTFCMLTPVVRTPVTNSGGNPVSVNDCSGQYAIDFNAYAKGLLGVAPHPALNIVGQRVAVQCWGRDPQGAVATTFLSDALEFVVGP
ncbi:MAG: PD40 domain-containing protein [Planctomycetes bacterium]|nr:PD40 domain-containing protein [Planctomycetota bacterium]